MTSPVRRNDPCPCGSGLRFKVCHGRLDGSPAAIEGEGPDAALERAQLAHQQGRIDEAERAYRAILDRHPGEPVAEHFLGVVQWQRGQLEEAEARMRRSIAARADAAPFRNNLALVLRDRGKAQEALAEFRAALAIDAGYAEAATNLGDTLLRTGAIQEAVAILRRASDAPTALVETFYMLGLALERAGRDEESLDALRRARERLGADTASRLSAKVRYRLGQTALRLGELEEGWAGYAWRPSRIAAGRDAAPLPERLEGLTVAIEEEQGLGDTLFFLRYAGGLRARGARLAFRGDARLAPILGRTGLFEEAPGRVDRVLLAGDLPRLLGSAGVAPALPLTPLPDRLAKAREALRGLRAPVAVAWRAGTRGADPQGILLKEIAPERLGQALAGVARDVVSVQRHPQPGETERFEAALGRPVRDLSGWNEDLEDALALMGETADCVGVSNTNVHLRAGVGRTAQVLVPFPPEWRWGARGESAWFPGFAVLRQRADGSWDEALRALGMLYSIA